MSLLPISKMDLTFTVSYLMIHFTTPWKKHLPTNKTEDEIFQFKLDFQKYFSNTSANALPCPYWFFSKNTERWHGTNKKS